MADQEKPKREAQFLDMSSPLLQNLEDPDFRRAVVRQVEKEEDEERQKADQTGSDPRYKGSR